MTRLSGCAEPQWGRSQHTRRAPIWRGVCKVEVMTYREILTNIVHHQYENRAEAYAVIARAFNARRIDQLEAGKLEAFTAMRYV